MSSWPCSVGIVDFGAMPSVLLRFSRSLTWLYELDSLSQQSKAFRKPMALNMGDEGQDTVAKKGIPCLPNSEKYVVAGCGAVSIDYLASVAKFPQPDEKIRSTESAIQGGGNAGNALTAAARLGLRPRVISKVAADAFGKFVLDGLEADGVDISFIVVSETGTTSFTYVIVDQQTNTRTCINTPAYPALEPGELPHGALDSLLEDARILYLDGRLPDTALVVAKEAKQRGVPILIDAERKRDGLDELLAVADYVVCSAKFPQIWTEAQSLADALVDMALKRPSLRFIIVTLGASGCVMFERSLSDSSNDVLLNANTILEELIKEKESMPTLKPFTFSSQVGAFQSGKKGRSIRGRFIYGTAETIAPAELVDTTGSGDAFIGAVLYSLCNGLSPEEMLPLGATVAGANCRQLGARAGLPYRHDPRLITLLDRPDTEPS